MCVIGYHSIGICRPNGEYGKSHGKQYNGRRRNMEVTNKRGKNPPNLN